jgi:MFS family permease
MNLEKHKTKNMEDADSADVADRVERGSVGTIEPDIDHVKPRRRFGAIEQRDFRLLWIGVFLSSIGTWMQTLAQGWLVRDLTPSPFLIGFVSFAGSFPQLAFSLFSGVYADMFDRRRLLLLTQILQLTLALSLGILVSLKMATIWHVIVLSFASGVATTFANPTYYAFMHDIVERDHLMSAIALNSTQYNLSRIIGPTIAGLMIGAVGIAGCFYINGLSFLAVIVAILMIRAASVGQTRFTGQREVLRQMIAGLRYIRGRPRVTATLIIAATVSLFVVPYLVFLPIFTRDVFGMDAKGLSYLMAATGVGAVFSALMQAYFSNHQRRGQVLVGGTTLFGAAVAGFALSRNFGLTLICLALAGAAMVSVTTTINNLLQTLVTDEMRGRVMSMYTFSFLGLPPLGSLLIGGLADLIGFRWGYHGTQLALAIGGFLIFAFAIGVTISFPRLRALA